jgi:hypothetical protein
MYGNNCISVKNTVSNPQNPTSGEHSETMTYDLRGNIQTLKSFSYIPRSCTNLSCSGIKQQRILQFCRK